MNNNNIEHIVHANPPRILGSDPMNTLIDSLLVMAEKQSTINTYASNLLENKNISDLIKE